MRSRMISYKYDIHEFLESIKGKYAMEAILLAQQESYEASCLTRGGRRGAPRAREMGCDRYENELGALIWFLNNAAKPSSIFDNLFQSYVATALTLTGYKQEFYDRCQNFLKQKT